MSGGLSGGTLDSLRGQLDEMRRDPALRKLAGDPYALSPDRAAEPDLGKERELQSVEHDSELGWLAPFVMAGINTRVVRRSNALQQHAYGSRFRYREVMSAGRDVLAPVKAGAIVAGLGGIVAGMSFGPDAQAARPRPPLPRRGPEREDAAQGLLRDRDPRRARASGAPLHRARRAEGRPGLRRDGGAARPERAVPGARRRPLPPGGGVLTPATAMGDVLADRLRVAG